MASIEITDYGVQALGSQGIEFLNLDRKTQIICQHPPPIIISHILITFMDA